MNVKELRQKLGISQSEFARRLDISVQTVNRWESGKFQPSRMAQRAIREVFGDTAK